MFRSAFEFLNRWLIEPRIPYDTAIQRKSRLLSTFLLVMILIFISLDTVYVLTIPGYAVPWYGYIFLVTAYTFNRFGYYMVSAYLVMGMFPIVVFISIVSGDATSATENLSYLILGLIVGSILLSLNDLLVLGIINIVGVLLLPRLAPSAFPAAHTIIGPLAIIMIGTLLIIIAMQHRDQLEADRQTLLRQSEERYRMLFEEAPDGILIISANNQILMANTALYRMTGYAPEDIIGHNPVEFVAPEDIERRPPRPISEIQVPGAMKRERVLICKNQSRLTVLIGSTYMPDGHLQYTIQDITERRKMEDALRASEEKFAKSFQSSPDSVTISSITTGKFIDVNDGFCQMSGYTREEALNHSAEELHIWDNVEHRQTMVTLLQQKGRVRDFETILRRKSGESVHCLLSVEIIDIRGEKCMVVITRDITQRKRIEEELQVSEERYRMVSSVISDYTFLTKMGEDGILRVVWIAGAFEKITGYKPGDFDAQGGWASVVHPDDIDQDEHDMEALRNNRRVVSEIRMIRKDGTIRWVRSYAHPVWDDEKNQLAGIYGAVQDITEQKRIELEREGLIKELEAKNAELEQFTYMVSHDLKAPIITIKGFLGFLSEDALSGNLQRLEIDIQRISEAADKMHRLLNDLLELSRVGRLLNDPEPIDVHGLIVEVERILQGQLERQTAQIRVHGPLPFVYGDRQRLFEVFQNLLDNASKFMGTQPNPLIEIGQDGTRQPDFVTLYVRDNGIGIASQFHERIFGLFNRLDPKVEGTGVGLALVKRIVEFHGGHIWVESEPDQGSVFFLTLPRAR